MGKKSAEIQYDLERQRHAVEARIQRLRRRIEDDMSTAKEEAQSDLEKTVGRESKVAEHPKALLAGSAVTGMVLGMLSESVSVPRPHLGRNGRTEEAEEEPRVSEQERKGLAGLATTAIVGSVQGQMNDLLSDAWNSFKSGFSGKGKVNDPSRLPPDVRGQPRAGGGSRAGSSIPGGAAAAHGTRYLSREEISPDAVDADMALEEGEKSPDEILHQARAEDYSPRENMPGYAGVQGEGLLLPRTPGVQAPYEEDETSERRTGQ